MGTEITTGSRLYTLAAALVGGLFGGLMAWAAFAAGDAHGEEANPLLQVGILLLAFGSIAWSVCSLRMLLGGPWFIRADATGLQVRAPAGPDPRRLFVAPKVVELALPWSRIARIYPIIHYVNGIRSGSTYRVVVADGPTHDFNLTMFRESAEQIRERLEPLLQGKLDS